MSIERHPPSRPWSAAAVAGALSAALGCSDAAEPEQTRDVPTHDHSLTEDPAMEPMVSMATRASPNTLSATGLYADIVAGEIDPTVEPYAPQFELWSDGAEKKRWIQIPAGEAIDTADMDAWVFPVGTKLWKEFERDGIRIETRLLEKVSATEWRRIAYEWNDDQTDADPVPNGVIDARGTRHDIPNAEECQTCHGSLGDGVLGFSAIQIAHSGDGITLDRAVDLGWLSDPPGETVLVPGDEIEAGAVGYLHANCGNCHHDGWGMANELPLRLRLRTADLAAVDQTAAFRTAVGVDGTWTKAPLIAPANPAESVVIAKMSKRGDGQMPPLGTEDIDADGLAVLEAWITSLAP